MNTIRESEPQRLIVREGQMVFDVPSREDGVEEIVYVTDNGTDDPAAPINLGGAWAGLIDGDAMLEALDRMGHERTSRRYPA
jgi:hypothetical protein